MTLRKEVRWMALQMERVLRLHDRQKGKRGWETMTNTSLRSLLWNEMHELEEAMFIHRHQSKTVELEEVNRVNVVKEAIDIANLAMMIASNNRLLRR